MGHVRSRKVAMAGGPHAASEAPPVQLWNWRGAVHSCCVSAVSSGLLACRAAFAHLTSRGRAAR